MTSLRIAFLVGNPAAQRGGFTTVALAREAARRGHHVAVVGVDDLMVDTDGRVHGRATADAGDAGDGRSDGEWYADLQRSDPVWWALDECDALMLRLLARPKGLDEDDGRYDTWYRGRIEAALAFARRVQRTSRTLVINDPVGLWASAGKLWLHDLPEKLFPRTRIARDEDSLREFVDGLDGEAVMKSLMGHGGEDVFRLRAGDPNLNAVMATLRRQGFVVAQEYVREVEDGERRLLLLDGEPVIADDGTPAIYLRRHAASDWRTNVHVGARPERCELRDIDREIAAALRPLVVERGLWLVGVDIVGDRVLEVNAFCPGGVGIVRQLTGFHAAGPIITALEQRVARETAAHSGASHRTEPASEQQ